MTALRDRRVAEERGAELALGERGSARKALRDDLGEVLVRARARAIRLEQSAQASIAQEPLGLRRLRLAWLDLDRDAGEDGRRREVPPFAEREARVRMERVRVVPLVDDPARVACRGSLPLAPRSAPPWSSSSERQARGFDRRRLCDGHDLLDAPPAVVASVARRGALGAERELARSVARVVCARGVGLHQRGQRARDRLSAPGVRDGERARRQLDRPADLGAMLVPHPRQVQRG